MHKENKGVLWLWISRCLQ